MPSKRVEVERLDEMNSYKLSKLVGELRCLRGAKKAVLRAVADRYPNIWPSVETIAEDAGFGTTQTRLCLRELETEGFISAMTDKGGGHGKTVQYEFIVAKVLSLIEAQHKASGIPIQSPTAADGNPTLSAQSPTASDGNPTGAVEEQRSKPRSEQKKEERKDCTPEGGAATAYSLSHSSSQRIAASATHGESPTCPENGRPKLAESYFAWLALTYDGLSLSRKQKAEISEFILTGSDDERTLKLGTARILDTLDITDSYAHAEEKLAVNLRAQAAAIRLYAEKRAEEERLVKLSIQKEKEKAAKWLAELEARQAAEAFQEDFEEVFQEEL